MDLIAQHRDVIFGEARVARETPPGVLEAARAYLADLDASEAAWEAYQALYETYHKAMERRIMSETKFLVLTADMEEGRNDWHQVDGRLVRRCRWDEENRVDVKEIEEDKK